MKKGFSLIELLVVIAIIAIILSFGIPWSMNYIVKKKVEKDTNAIYLALKQAQIEAKLRKSNICIKLSNPQSLEIRLFDTDCNGSIITTLKLDSQFYSNESYLKVNQFGIFTINGSIYYNSTAKDIIDCVKAYRLRVCEGYWNGSECICKY